MNTTHEQLEEMTDREVNRPLENKALFEQLMFGYDLVASIAVDKATGRWATTWPNGKFARAGRIL